MRKIILLIIALLLINSCYEGNPLDPAKGIDSQGETTLFTGKVTEVSGNPRSGVLITCNKYGYSIGDLLWSTTTDSNGFYAIRHDLSDLSYYDIILKAAGSHDIIIEGGERDYDSDRESRFEPVIKQDFQY